MSRERTDVGPGTSMWGAAESGRQDWCSMRGPGTLPTREAGAFPRKLGWRTMCVVGGVVPAHPLGPSSDGRTSGPWGTILVPPSSLWLAWPPQPLACILSLPKELCNPEPGPRPAWGREVTRQLIPTKRPSAPHSPAPQDLTFGVQLGPVALKAFEPHHVAQQGEELHEGGSCLAVVVHVLLRGLARAAVQDAHLALEAQLPGWGGGGQMEGPGLSLWGPPPRSWGMTRGPGCLYMWP